MYHSHLFNKQYFVEEYCFIYCTNLSWHHSLQGVSSISAGSVTIPRREGHLTVSASWLEEGGLVRRGSTEFNVRVKLGIIFNGST